MLESELLGKIGEVKKCITRLKYDILDGLWDLKYNLRFRKVVRTDDGLRSLYFHSRIHENRINFRASRQNDERLLKHGLITSEQFQEGLKRDLEEHHPIYPTH